MADIRSNIIGTINKDELIEILTEELPALRAKIGIKQEELSYIIGVSRQIHGAIETKKRNMTWNMYISLLMFFTQNEKTSSIIEAIGAYPKKLKKAMNINNRI